MDPIVAGLLSNLGYNAIKSSAKLSFQPTVEDHLDNAAQSVAEGYSDLEASDLLGLMESEEMADHAESFNQGQPLPIEELAEELADHPVNKFLDEDAASVIEEFLTAFEQELAAKPELWRQIVLKYVKAQRNSVQDVKSGQQIELQTLQSAIETLKTDIDALHGLVEPEELDEALEGLRNDGFRLLTSADFENGECEPENCWRRPFYFQEIRAGYAIERELPPMDERDGDELAIDGGRTNVVRQLTSNLRGGNERVVVGNPGSGKSTLLKTVADRWDQNEDTGTILYRGHGEAAAYAMDSAGDFIENVETVAEQQGPVLVIVEDAARDATIPLFEAIYRHLDDDSISYLLDSRDEEWDDERFETRLRRNDAIDRGSAVGQHIWNTFDEQVESVPVPPLDRHEVERIIEKFKSNTESDEELSATPEEIFDRIQSHRGVSSMLLLVYYLPVGGIQPDRSSNRSILEQNVIEVYDAINSPSESDRTLVPDLSESDQTLFEQLGLAIATLNLMESGIHRELLLTLASTQEERQQIDDFLEALSGAFVFGNDGNQYHSHHELWSYLYLKQHLDEHGQAATPRQKFENCVDAMFSIAEQDVRNEVRGHVGPSSLLELIEENPSEFIEVFVSDLFGIVNKRAQLIPLYAGSDYSDIDIPDNCSTDLEIACARVRRDAWLRQGDRSNSAEYRHVKKESEIIRQKQLEKSEKDPMRIDADYFLRRGRVANQQGKAKAVERWNKRAIRLYHEVEDRAGEADCLNNLGIVALDQGDYEQAREYYTQSLEIKHDLSDRVDAASILNNLGVVADKQGDYEQAREYYTQSLEIQRELDNRAGEADCLTNLGTVAGNQGDYEQAREYLKKSLEIQRELGDRAREAKILGNLGVVARHQDDYEQAREYHSQGLKIERELGNRAGEAASLNNIGNVAREQDDLKDAQEYYSQASERFLELEALRRALKALSNLSEVADDRGDTETARDACKQALSLIESTNISGLSEHASEFRASLARLGDASMIELYARGLERILANKGGTAMELLETTWEHREEIEPSDEAYPLVLGAGVGFAAHIELADSDEAETDVDTVLSTVEPHVNDLSPAARALLDYLTDSEPDVTPNGLRDDAANIDDDEPLADQVDALEARAYAGLLELLAGEAIGELSTDAIYRRALEEMSSDDADAQKVINLLTTAWNRRDDHTAGGDKHTVAMGAGVGLAVHIELLDIEIDDEDPTPEEILDEIEPYTDNLSAAVRATYQHLVADEPLATPDELRDSVEIDSEEPTLNDIESIVFAGLLKILREE